MDQTVPSNLPLVFDDDRCLFNTGLYTRRYETIYGLLSPTQARRAPALVFKGLL